MQFSHQITVRKPALIGEKGMVSAQSGAAAQIGADILSIGGNAADAAIATSFAMGVFEPWMSGIGGGGALVFWHEAEKCAYSIDFGLKTSQNLDMDNYPLSGDGLSNDLFPWPNVVGGVNEQGVHSIAVPGTVAGMLMLHEKFGSLPWKTLIEPSVKAARHGLPIDWYSALVISSNYERISIDDDMAELFLGKAKIPPSTTKIAAGNQTIKFDALAYCLQTIAEEGGESFYTGEVAKQLIADLDKKGCALSLDDLASYRAQFSRAQDFTYGDHQIFYPSGLNAGSTLADMFGGLTPKLDPKPSQPNAQWYESMANGLRAAQAKRWREDGDVHEAETSPSCTTHFSVADEMGNFCSVTQTNLSVFGSGVLSSSTGVMLNNGVMWFDPEPNKPNSIAAGKQCLMNICPIIGKSDNIDYAIGAAGGRKILSCVAQIIGFMSDFDMDFETSFHQPRIDSSNIDLIVLDQNLMPDIKQYLQSNYKCKQVFKTVWPLPFAAASGVAVQDGLLVGCTEPTLPWSDSRTAME
ncbi:MAG: gamma-glutamyltransferase family protein [Hyphomicrobiales bacterium]